MQMIIRTDLPATTLNDLYDLMAPMPDGAEAPLETDKKVELWFSDVTQPFLDSVAQLAQHFGVSAIIRHVPAHAAGAAAQG